MGAEGAFADLSVQYLRVYALSSPVTTIIFAVDNFMRISGYIRGSMLLNIFMSLLSGVLEFLFLGVFHFGIWGAALATCSGMFVCALIAFTPFFRGKAVLHFCRPHFHMRMVRQILACGSPNFLNNIAGRITSILLNLILVRLGSARRPSPCMVFLCLLMDLCSRFSMAHADSLLGLPWGTTGGRKNTLACGPLSAAALARPSFFLRRRLL